MNTEKYIFAQLIEPRIFEEFAYHMIDIARKKRINKDLLLFWHFYHDSAAIVIVGVDSQFAAQVFGMSAGQW